MIGPIWLARCHSHPNVQADSRSMRNAWMGLMRADNFARTRCRSGTRRTNMVRGSVEQHSKNEYLSIKNGVSQSLSPLLPIMSRPEIYHSMAENHFCLLPTSLPDTIIAVNPLFTFVRGLLIWYFPSQTFADLQLWLQLWLTRLATHSRLRAFEISQREKAHWPSQSRRIAAHLERSRLTTTKVGTWVSKI